MERPLPTNFASLEGTEENFLLRLWYLYAFLLPWVRKRMFAGSSPQKLKAKIWSQSAAPKGGGRR
jgi:hypothetical protein